jgi:hypothetical protein
MSARQTGLLFGRDAITVPGIRTRYDFQLVDISFGLLPTAWAAVDFAAGQMFVGPRQVETLLDPAPGLA